VLKFRLEKWLNVLLLIALVIILNVLAGLFYHAWDFTEEKKYTLTKPSEELLKSIDDIIYVNVLLEGQFPAGFKRLRNATREMLEEFRSLSPYIQYAFENPNEGSPEEVNARREELVQEGLIPTNLRTREAGEAKQQQIFPYAIFNFGTRKVIVNLLEPDQPGMPPEVTLNNSVSLLEYKMANAIQKLKLTQKPNILFTTGHGELEMLQTRSFEKELQRYYKTGRVDLSESVQLSADIDLLIVAKPKTAFPLQHQYLIDQYIVKGGSVMFLIDPLDVNLDSINLKRNFIPKPLNLNLDRLFFKYGARLQTDLVLDLQCTRIPMVVGTQGNQPQTELFSWYYHPLVTPSSQHPIAKNLGLINLLFPASIDTVQTKTSIKKTILLQSSEYSRIQLTPVRLNFDIVGEEPIPEKFNKPNQSLAILLEGAFESAYANRMTPEMMQLTEQLGAPFQSMGTPGKVLIVSDGDLIKNLVNRNTSEVSPVGYNRYENFIFKGNQDFLLNSVEYMIGEGDVLAARSKEVKLRLLDTVKAEANATKWQLINIVLPLVFLVLFGLIFNFLRKRKYGKVAA
jgi:ABC-2 type transport system permease protein